ncbi:SRPBCC family protein [Deinococcus ruber]|uniref:Activator of Hsp90 ATPase homologue 1/2-like C-terminal domain-containing protein n=1 Tax=Deinococcus ruber TaxID=1848197 RepID=A0A918F8P7_9DEIO|nr:SRPBCC family protein [Deinococcus ruber]GGR16161.1 hypothetical protein GCM10008957_31000 [Deinococcus ruber]
MSNKAVEGPRILGRLGSVDSQGMVRIEDRFDTEIEDLWSALTNPLRLARWIGEVKGDLRLGGTFHARYFASGWEGTGYVQVCEPPRRLVIVTTEAEGSDKHITEATLTADGDQTLLVIEERGLPRHQLAGYGAGIQVHVEDLAAYLAGQERCDASARWAVLFPAYQALEADLR